MFSKLPKQTLIEGSNTIVVELGSNGAVNRHCIWSPVEGTAIALHLLGYIPECILRSFAIKLVDSKHIGIIQHVDFLQLAGSTEFGSHHVQRGVYKRHDASVILANARRLYNDDFEPKQFYGVENLG